jgi:hypothetical protein
MELPQVAVCFVKLAGNLCYVRELQSQISPRKFVSLVQSLFALEFLTG